MSKSRNSRQYLGVRSILPPDLQKATRAPTTSDTAFITGTLWLDTSSGATYMYNGAGSWIALGGGAVSIDSLTGDTGGAIAPVSGNINLLGSSSIDAAGSIGQIAFSVNENLPQYAEVTLTSAQVKALATTPIELVATPGAGNVIQFLGATLKLDYGGTNVFSEAGDNLGVKYTNASGVQVSQDVETTGFIDQSADTYTNAEPAINAIVAATGAENQALVLDNLNANIAGNAANDNTLIVSVLYRVISI